MGLIGTTGYNTVYERWAIFTLNLLGDPEMQVYRSRHLRRFVVKIADAMQRGPTVIHVVEVHPPTPVPHPEPPIEVLVHIRQGETVYTARTDAFDQAHFDMSNLALGEVEITASHDEFVPYRLNTTLTGPDWVRGTVLEISHRDGGRHSSLVRLQVDDTQHNFCVNGECPDYRLILDALENAFVLG